MDKELTLLQMKSAGCLQGQTVMREVEVDSGLAELPGPWLALVRKGNVGAPCSGRGTPKGEGGTR